MTSTATESEYTRIPIFISATGKVHRAKTYGWGVGTACDNGFLSGSPAEGLVGDVTCEHCDAWRTPTTYDVVVSDGRYKSGHRLVHAEVGTLEEAQALAEQIGERATVMETPRGEDDAA